jgi:succinate-semialdehyde dehydrogenase/glutarate-semialdehyde dehydrogenase
MYLKSYNPATGELVGEVPVTPPENIPGVVARARAAWPAWRDLGARARMERILPAGKKLVDRAEDLGRLLTLEMGKPLREAVGEVRSRGSELEKDLDEIAAAVEPEVLEDEHTRTVLYHDPFGVCAAITPWNFPIAMPHWMVMPALVAGNTVVLKPSEETPLIAQAYASILNEGLPRDVLQVVHGDEAQGKALVEADVDLIAFTGSREAGKHILGAASRDLKRVILELGGKDPLVVLDDADVKAAAKFAVRNSFRNAGQVCVSTERIYVLDSIADAFEREVVRQTAELRVGNGLEDGARIGPMINERQRDHVLRQIEEAVQRGARVLRGGDAPRGNFLAPAVLSGVTHEMGIMREETFGPVACIARVRDEEEAIEMANDSRFGLGAVVFGGDEARAEAVARRLDAGMIGINRGVGGASGSPWVGAKESGFGFHGGRDGHRQFTQARVLSRPRG